jgi:hypothetical protein
MTAVSLVSCADEGANEATNQNGHSVMVGAGFTTFDADLGGCKNGGPNPDGYRSWLLNATATNMAYMLSAQLSATVLDIRNGFVADGAIVYAPGTSSADANGFATLTALIAEADAPLAADGWVLADHPERAHQEALKNAFDSANNNLNFLQTSQETCPLPAFE